MKVLFVKHVAWEGPHRIADAFDDAEALRANCQDFRAGNAWGLLFHPEADRELVEGWLAEPAMAAEARAALGADAEVELRQGSRRWGSQLIRRSSLGFEAFARLAADEAGSRSVTG